MKKATLVFLIDTESQQICLAMKKRGFGTGKWNGYGGKVGDTEEVIDAAIRELAEETRAEGSEQSTVVQKQDLVYVGIFDFMFPDPKLPGQQVYVYLAYKWEGEPVESEEMRPKWFPISDIPYGSMWPDDELWLPRVLNGEKLQGEFVFADDDTIISYEISPIAEDFLPNLR